MLKSPFTDRPGGPETPSAIPGKKVGCELDSYKISSDIPVGESIMGSPAPSTKIDTPFMDGNTQSAPPVRGRKNP